LVDSENIVQESVILDLIIILCKYIPTDIYLAVPNIKCLLVHIILFVCK
jgi:hypothetical protein